MGRSSLSRVRWTSRTRPLKSHLRRSHLALSADVDKAVAAAKAAFPSFSQTSVEYRAELLDKITAGIQARMGDMAEAISDEMGAPMWLANAAQVPAGMGHVATMAQILRNYEFEEKRGTTLLRKEPIGVCGFITPWNWPLNQITCKVAPAIAAGCTMVLKPSEISPLNAIIFTEVMHEAGVPPGVFNLVNGDGPSVGAHLSGHPDVDMMSFTGSTRAGVSSSHRPRHRPSSASHKSSAASRRTSSYRAPTCKRPLAAA